ncbi:hypothetical protein NDU88_003961 [Pleurodeles waltl]|uniref:Uncharacterized protein n=1 Tax=Pleurodeles waltl TaxID=8319 RepID=A0AAV7LIE5_PLEWA|nr:hypothetical protein NDU88_003961 [Pleurodeles waltl]
MCATRPGLTVPIYGRSWLGLLSSLRDPVEVSVARDMCLICLQVMGKRKVLASGLSNHNPLALSLNVGVERMKGDEMGYPIESGRNRGMQCKWRNVDASAFWKQLVEENREKFDQSLTTDTAPSLELGTFADISASVSA